MITSKNRFSCNDAIKQRFRPQEQNCSPLININTLGSTADYAGPQLADCQTTDFVNGASVVCTFELFVYGLDNIWWTRILIDLFLNVEPKSVLIFLSQKLLMVLNLWNNLKTRQKVFVFVFELYFHFVFQAAITARGGGDKVLMAR